MTIAKRLARSRRPGRISRRGILRSAGAALAVAAVGLVARPSIRGPRPARAGGELRVRRDAKSLSAAEKRAFTDAVLALKQRPSFWLETLSAYDLLVYWHRETYDCLIEAAHMRPAFLPWHRMFLLYFEQQLREIDPTVTIPYWDWSVDQGADAYLWRDDLMGGNGDPERGHAVVSGPFRRDAWQLAVFDLDDDARLPYIVRDFGRFPGVPELPTPADVEAALAVPSYDVAPWDRSSDVMRSFRNFLEGWRDCPPWDCEMPSRCTGPRALHNAVHLWVAGEFELAHGEHETAEGPDEITGTMAGATSPNDPVFWLHHANIDRIWAQWQRRHGIDNYQPVRGGPLGHNLNDRMWPFYTFGQNVTPRDMLDHRALGYRYDSEPA